MTTWTIAVDWDRNGDYSSAQDDVTNRVIAATWFLGMRKPFQDTADNAALTLTLDNTDRLFSPENASSPLFGKLVPQRPVRIQSNDGTTTRTHWVGWIDSIQPVVGLHRHRRRALLEGHVGHRHLFRADTLVRHIIVLDVDRARLVRFNRDHRLIQLPQHILRAGADGARVGDDRHLVLERVQPGVAVSQIGHAVVERRQRGIALQQVMAVPEDGLALAVEEEAPALGRRHVADGTIDVEAVLRDVGVAALAHPVVGGDAQMQHARFEFAVGGGGGQIRRGAQFAAAGAAEHPRPVEGRRDDDFLDQVGDDLVGALVALERQGCFSGLEELHGTDRDQFDGALAVAADDRLDTVNPANPVGAGGRAVIGLNAQRPLRNQLAEKRRRDVLRREKTVGVVESQPKQRVIGNIGVHLIEAQRPFRRNDPVGHVILCAAVIAVAIPINFDCPSGWHHINQWCGL